MGRPITVQQQRWFGGRGEEADAEGYIPSDQDKYKCKKYKDKYKGKYKDKDRGREQMLRVTASQVLVFLLTIYAYLSKIFQPESQDIPTRMRIMLFKI